MKSISFLRSLLTGMLLICLGSVAFVGCSDVTTLNGLVPVQLTGSIAQPKDAAPGTTMTITKTDNTTEIRTVDKVSDGLSLPATDTMSFNATSSVAGQAPAIVVKLLDAAGAVIGTSNPITLTTQNGGVSSGSINLPKLNAGESYEIDLADNTLLNVSALVAGMTRAAEIPVGLQIKKLRLRASFTAAGLTLPYTFDLNLKKTSAGKFILADSSMKIFWTDTLYSKVPANNCATLSLVLFDGATNKGTVDQKVGVTNKVATFTGKSTVPFNGVEITLDVRNNN